MKRSEKDKRLLTWAIYLASSMSTCRRGRHCCLIVRGGLIISTGYNGSVDGEPHCSDVGCKLLWAYPESQGTSRPVLHCVRTIHAERNAILNAAINGISISDADWYVTGVPCWECSKMIARAKPRRLVLAGRPEEEGFSSEEMRMLDWWRERMRKFGGRMKIYDRKMLDNMLRSGAAFGP